MTDSLSKSHIDGLTNLPVVTQGKVGTSSKVVNLTRRPAGQLSRGHRPHGKDIISSGTGSTK